MKTLALKRKTTIAKVIRNRRIFTVVKRKAGDKMIQFYDNSNWRTNRDAFSKAKDVDLVKMSAQLRTRSKLGFDCCICGESKGVEMHHVRHVREMSDKKAKGFMRVMAILNRKQIPVCKQCHRKIHSGAYDGLRLEDLAYDPSKLNGLDVQLSQLRNELPEAPVTKPDSEQQVFTETPRYFTRNFAEPRNNQQITIDSL